MRNPLAGRYDDLAIGLLFGAAAALVCLAGWAWRRRMYRGEPTRLAGLALAAANASGLAATGAPAQLALAWPWMAVAAVIAGILMADFDQRWRRHGLTLPLLAVSTAGVYATVPDVEAALVVLGATLPTCLLGWPGLLARFWPAAGDNGTIRSLDQPPPSLGGAGALAMAGVLVWTVMTGGVGRPASVVGGLGCLGLFAIEPIARLLDPRRRSWLEAVHRSRVAWSAVALQLLLVAVAARVVGRRISVVSALLLGGLELTLALAAATVVSRRAARDRRPS